MDTHVLIWAIGEPSRLGERTRAAVASPANQVLVSAATAWEIAIKHALGRLTFPVDRFEEVLQRMGFDPLPVQLPHAIAAGRLPRHHDDPFDRMLIAQALTDGLTLATIDGAMARYDVPVLADCRAIALQNSARRRAR
nr:type II toxin-antitoxin system VapC family toxin [Rhodopila globiformis]